MIFTKAPYRVSLFGGSTDYEDFYSQYGSLLIGFTLNHYCHLAVRETPVILPYKYKITYSSIEEVNNIKDIKHNGVRGVIEFFEQNNFVFENGLEIHTLADLPAQTGIGSSSSFIVALIKALCEIKNISHDPKTIADLAIYIERKFLNESGGIQDQIFASYGMSTGQFMSININIDGTYEVKNLNLSKEFYDKLNSRSVLLYLGRSRESFEIAKSHIGSHNIKYEILEHSYAALNEFRRNNINNLGKLLHESWLLKKKISKKISSSNIDYLYDKCRQNGAIGGKLLGAGGSGFFYLILDENIDKKIFLSNINEIGLYNVEF